MAQPAAPRFIAGPHQDRAANSGEPDRSDPARGRVSRQRAAAILRSAALPPSSLWSRLPGAVAAVLAGVFLFDPVISRSAGLALLYVALPVAVAAIELAGVMPKSSRAVALEFAMGAWVLVLVLVAAAFIRFGITHGIAAVAITVVVADLASFFVAVLPRRLPPSAEPPASLSHTGRVSSR